jgi:stearoyl-CoA desaturase (delta-9 desaturase)
MRWWEPDLSGYIIAGLSKVGVVWDLYMPSRTTINNKLSRNKLANADSEMTPITEEV